MLQYKIPQNVGIEDKIVGPLSLRQLIIIAVGCGSSYVIFAILNKFYELNYLEYAVIAIPALISAAAALVRINDVPFTKFILLSIEFAIKPKKRAWNHRGIAPLVAPDLTEIKMKKDEKVEEKTKKPVNLDDLSRILDSSGFKEVKTVEHEDMDKVGDEQLVTQAFFGKTKNEIGNMYFRANKYENTKKRLDILAKLPRTEPKKEAAKVAIPVAPKAAPVTKPEPPKAQPPVIIKPAPIPAPAPKPIQPTPPPSGERKIEIKSVPPVPPKAVPPVAQKPVQPPAPKPQPTPQKQTPVMEQPAQKKKRQRHKGSKATSPIPERQFTQVNTIQKNQPMKLIQGVPPKAPEPPKPQAQAQKPKAGEFELKELQKGEIEINLND